MTLPEAEAMVLLRHLRSSSISERSIAAMEGSMQDRQRPSDLRAARGLLPRTDTTFEFELSAMHHKVYPALVLLDAVSSGHFSLETTRSVSPVSPLPPLRVSLACDRRSAVGSPALRSASSQQYCDPRLTNLDIKYWSPVPISNEDAAALISLYLQVDHAFLGFFSADLFLSDLIHHKSDYCSAFLVSSVLYLGCVSAPARLLGECFCCLSYSSSTCSSPTPRSTQKQKLSLTLSNNKQNNYFSSSGRRTASLPWLQSTCSALDMS
jgi:hypothetical protein